MIGNIDPEASIGYLTLGVFAQSIAERLSELPSQDPAVQETALAESITALRAVKDREFEDVETATGLRPFQDYDQVTTLYEVLQHDDIKITLDTVIEFLESLKSKGEQVDSDLRKRVVRFFDNLALEALQLSRQPPEGIPSGVRD